MQKLNLSFPTSWQSCSLKQLEQIASALVDVAERTDRFHPFDMKEVKVALFFLMSGIKILEPLSVNEKGDEGYVVTHSDVKEPFFLELWKVNSFVNGVPDVETIGQAEPQMEQEGVFDWLDDDSHSGPLLFPYCEVATSSRILTKHYKGVEPLMQNFTWERYRHCQDWLEEYLRRENLRIKALNNARGCPERSILYKKLAEATSEADHARASFLSELLTGTDEKFHEFEKFDKVKWQVILFWWAEQMHYLHRTYPRCFKKQGVKGKNPTNPFQLYTRTIATMEKYLGLDEEKVNNQTYTLVLQHLEDMAKESEEIEKMKRKK